MYQIDKKIDFRFIHLFFLGNLIILHTTFIFTLDIEIPTPTNIASCTQK